MFLTLWGITLVSFTMLHLTPGSPVEMKMMQTPDGSLGEHSELTQEMIDRLKKQYHLDKPIIVRYFLWLKDILRFDFGTSLYNHLSVSELILERIPVSLIFGFSGILVALFVGIPLGLLAGVFSNGFMDRAVAIVSIAMYAMPAYALALLLIVFFAGPDFFPIFPIAGIQSTNFESLSFFEQIGDRLFHFVLPCICYTIGGLAFISQQQRASLLEALNQDYIRTARAKGLSEFKVYMKHAFRNSLIPIVTILGAMLPSILGASILIEKIFSIPGLGELTFEALIKRDYPIIMANFTVGAFLSLMGIFLSDLLYVVVDPRISFD